MEVNIIGAGLAGCEAGYYLAKRNIKVKLYDIKPQKFTVAHSNINFAELVCSNSLKNLQISNAAGLLKQELRELNSLIMESADYTKVPSGNALSVNRDDFAEYITNKIKSQSNIEIICKEITDIDTSKPTIICTGPLTTEKLSNNIAIKIGQDYLHFFDASAPIVNRASIDMDFAYFASRYDKGEADYLNCPMNKEQYEAFYNELVNAKRVILKEFEDEKVFEGCMPVEVMAKRGFKSLLFGPLKPVGLKDPKTGKASYAVLQLRSENVENTMYNLVGFQTNLLYSEQSRVFSMIPALHNAEFIKYGVMHKNIFINAPIVLNEHYQVKAFPNIFIAGQLSGVEGYIESVSSGLVSAINMLKYLNNENLIAFPSTTCIGALSNYLTHADYKYFQPMNANWGIIKEIELIGKDKIKNKELQANYALNQIKEYKNNHNI
ncbi:MAG: methylenetetrahydrofolate--tRNA-(uracil(54)-C(5))-methyltransferase (FADH(2)-oxidizing) TrmFO [Clostridia bacterium]|nr:methylenetetrahydrofolate--tRNA-(uracil(54)-C(5))-methyltransferase (FADH(2)-oxidizing) TrmFO [Clostridia bacterium]